MYIMVFIKLCQVYLLSRIILFYYTVNCLRFAQTQPPQFRPPPLPNNHLIFTLRQKQSRAILYLLTAQLTKVNKYNMNNNLTTQQLEHQLELISKYSEMLLDMIQNSESNDKVIEELKYNIRRCKSPSTRYLTVKAYDSIEADIFNYKQ